jgi:hypothetical protein
MTAGKKFAYVFAGLVLSVGVGLLTGVIAFLSLRERYLGPPLSHIPTARGNENELMYVCLFFGDGAGLLTSSLLIFYALARSKRMEGEKHPSPEV